MQWLETDRSDGQPSKKTLPDFLEKYLFLDFFAHCTDYCQKKIEIYKSELCFWCKVFFFRPIRLSYVGISYQNRQNTHIWQTPEYVRNLPWSFFRLFLPQNVALSKFHCCLLSVFPQTCRTTFSNSATSKSDLHNLVDNVFDKNLNCLSTGLQGNWTKKILWVCRRTTKKRWNYYSFLVYFYTFICNFPKIKHISGVSILRYLWIQMSS